MDLQWNDAAVAGRVESYIEDLARVLDHKHRHEPFRHYCTGLLLPRNRKSVEPMAARLAPGWVTAEHQLLLHFVGPVAVVVGGSAGGGPGVGSAGADGARAGRDLDCRLPQPSTGSVAPAPSIFPRRQPN